jgi:hypothetical protein
LPNVVGDEIGETGLEDGDFAALERRDPRSILIDAGDVVTEIGETGSRNEGDIAGADCAATPFGCAGVAPQGFSSAGSFSIPEFASWCS